MVVLQSIKSPTQLVDTEPFAPRGNTGFRFLGAAAYILSTNQYIILSYVC